MLKRVLILDKKENGVTVSKSVAEIVICTNTEDVLPILMGGSSAFGNDNYHKTGKVRPEMLVMDSSYLETHEGLEILEIIRKYYTLRNVSIFVASDKHQALDPAFTKRYKISGVLPKPLDLDSLLQPGSPPDNSHFSPREGSFLSGIAFLTQNKFKALAVKLAQVKAWVVASVPVLSTGKAIVAASGIIVTSTVIGFADSPKGKSFRSKITAPMVQEEAMAAVKEEPLLIDSDTAITVEPAPVPEEKTVVKKHLPLIEKAQVAETITEPAPAPAVVTRPQREAKIQVVPDEEPLESE